MTGNPSPDADTKTSTASAESEYQQLRQYEQQYDTKQMEIRKLASIWLLAALGAVAYLVRGDGSKAIVNPMILIGVVGLMGNIGLLVLWILDQLVYHNLLNAVFLLGLRMEYANRNNPPIRTLMMLFSEKRGMARYQLLFYLIPMVFLSFLVIIALLAWMWHVTDPSQEPRSGFKLIVPLIIMAFALAIPLWVTWRRRDLEDFKVVAKEFGDEEFTAYLAGSRFEKVLSAAYQQTSQLHSIARGYVHSLGMGDFDAIPYDSDVELRSPLYPGGSSVLLVGRSDLKAVWWAPLSNLIAGTEVIETYVNENLSAVTIEFLCHIKAPACTLRIFDRFTINPEGRITSQENFFDPRDVTNPGWREV